MDVIVFVYVSLGSSTVQLYDAHAQVEKLVSVFKMPALLVLCVCVFFFVFCGG
jgi:hypothetical protein